MKARIFTLLFLIAATAALAHEFWLQPASFRVLPGTAVPLRLLSGENFAGETWPRPTRRVRRFVRLGPTPLDSADLRPVLLADSVAPAVRCGAPGTHVVVLTSQPAFMELPAAQFTAYLREEGLDLALRQRQEADESGTKPGREAYRRCAKSLVFAAGPTAPAAAADTTFRRVLGLPLELVPEQNPYRLRPGAALTVRVLRQGQPVPGALVQVWDASPPAVTGLSRFSAKPTGVITPQHFTTHTNAQGRVLVRLPGAGPYLLAAVRMEAAPPALANRADWLSTWASLTFGGPSFSMKVY
ncbi:DUF4198 domain-containing protein [Hymenobacter sp. HMF4947]|uniref:DUF4198 domain-containing protein n=1 Tax=Hymenobacter ginkgonis TaxID=2682976 RepID=A0A7K1T8S7_9BACT|nr:DUF4198 domain-containing protein [Hymenobacter ginkgonis]MVN74804.1 DUF4198 domain-containing protein [Hymenobacter ginkgonis]